MSKPYTVREIDALRTACEARWLFGTTDWGQHLSSRSYRPEERDRGVEEMLRTYIMAGIRADEIYAEDGVEPPKPFYKQDICDE